MSWLDPRNVFGMPEIKAEGDTVAGASLSTALGTIKGSYSNRYVDPFREHEEALKRIEYILARTVPDYDELVNQFNAIKDIERSNRE